MNASLLVKLWRKSIFYACSTLVIGATILHLFQPNAMASDLQIPLEVPGYNFVGLGIGGYPDYNGSDDYSWGIAPLARVSLGGERYVSVIATDVRVNLINDLNWRGGPEFLWRFDREDIDDEVVKQLHKTDGSANLGLFGGYVWKQPEELRKQIGITVWGFWDVSGVSDGWNAGTNFYGMYPVARPVTIAAGVGATYGSEDYMDTYYGVTASDSLASGLPVFSAGGSMRDARGWIVAMVHLSENWHTGAGVLYSRMLGDGVDSPIVSERGSKDQWIYGVGLLYSWK